MNKLIVLFALFSVLYANNFLRKEAVWVDYLVPSDYQTNEKSFLHRPALLLADELEKRGLKFLDIRDV